MRFHLPSILIRLNTETFENLASEMERFVYGFRNGAFRKRASVDSKTRRKHTIFSRIEAAVSIYFFNNVLRRLRAASIYHIFCNNLGLSYMVPALYLIGQMALLGNLSSV